MLAFVLVLIAGLGGTAGYAADPTAHAAATCSDYSTQAEAQRAADTRDADGDGVYCESLPCPCAGPSGAQPTPTPEPTATPQPTPEPTSTPDPEPAPEEDGEATTCLKPTGVQRISFSKTKYRNIRAHYLAAVHRGWPRVLLLNRPGADARGARGRPTRPADRWALRSSQRSVSALASGDYHRRCLSEGIVRHGARTEAARIQSALTDPRGLALVVLP